MGEYTIVKCKGCGRTFRIYMGEHFPGDPNYCRDCNRKSEEPQSPRKQ